LELDGGSFMALPTRSDLLFIEVDQLDDPVEVPLNVLGLMSRAQVRTGGGRAGSKTTARRRRGGANLGGIATILSHNPLNVWDWT
jgi:hypothetical protein